VLNLDVHIDSQLMGMTEVTTDNTDTTDRHDLSIAAAGVVSEFFTE